jgi:hypothetical protein
MSCVCDDEQSFTSSWHEVTQRILYQSKLPEQDWRQSRNHTAIVSNPGIGMPIYALTGNTYYKFNIIIN